MSANGWQIRKGGYPMLIYRVKFKILSAVKKTDSNSCPVSLVVYRGDKYIHRAMRKF
jgi:hypothetical protein